MSFIGAFRDASAENEEKDKTFRTCMEELDWKMKREAG
ncbi:hypothetical protein NKDENANG_02182 [Candidatus Entotheonellaceae bacterium PAL068K]